MEHVKEKMAQARQHRKMLQENPQAQTDFIQADRDSTSNLAKFNRYLSLGRNASLFIGGAAAGIVVVAIVWWVKSAGVAGDTSTIALETAEAIQARGARWRVGSSRDQPRSVISASEGSLAGAMGAACWLAFVLSLPRSRVGVLSFPRSRVGVLAVDP